MIELSLNTVISTTPEDLGNCYDAYRLRERPAPGIGSSGLSTLREYWRICELVHGIIHTSTTGTLSLCFRPSVL